MSCEQNGRSWWFSEGTKKKKNRGPFISIICTCYKHPKVFHENNTHTRTFHSLLKKAPLSETKHHHPCADSQVYFEVVVFFFIDFSPEQRFMDNLHSSVICSLLAYMVSIESNVCDCRKASAPYVSLQKNMMIQCHRLFRTDNGSILLFFICCYRGGATKQHLDCNCVKRLRLRTAYLWLVRLLLLLPCLKVIANPS